MADTASASTPATPPADARPVQPASGEKAPPEAKTPNQSTPAPTTGQQRGMSEEERVRRLQSTYTQQQRALQQQIAQRDQQLQQMQAQLTALQTKDMDDVEAQNYRANQYIIQLEQEIAARRDAEQNQIAQMKINQALWKIAGQTQIPFNELQEKFFELGDADDTWAWATQQLVQKLTPAQAKAGEKAAQQLQAAQEEEAETQVNEKEVDLGNGKAPGYKNEFQSAYEQNDAQAYVKAYLNNLKR